MYMKMTFGVVMMLR